jgi:ribosomal protein S4
MSESLGINNCGAPRKYDTELEKHVAFRQQQNEYLKRLRTKQSNIGKAKSEKQKQLIKYLQSNVIKNENLLDLIYTRFQKHRFGLTVETLEL